MRPDSRRMMREASSRASRRSCVTKTMVLPRRRTSSPNSRCSSRAGDRVERAEGLVHQQNGRIGSECAGYADALALAAGKFVRAAGGEFVRIETDEGEEFFDALRNASRIPFFQFGNQSDILCDGEVGEQSAFLNDVPDAAAQANGIPLGGGAALDEHLAGLGR